MRLKDKVAIVTGGAQGIGRVYALGLAKEGARVVVTDILDPNPAAKEIEQAGGQALALTVDVTSERDTLEMARQAVERFGRIDVLVNNAAIYGQIVRRPFYEVDIAEWDRVMAVNLKGIFLCCRAVFPQMRKQGKGKIINISSSTFFKGVPMFLHYVTSKGGVIALTRALAREVGDYGILVNAIAPGYTMSETNLKNPAELDKVNVQARCLKRTQMPQDLVGTVIFLGSDESDFITGQTILVDGGNAMH
ncbi:MAG: 3-oxoacyl-ACP reductase FabG [Deltaproteobacteria bacterium]|nr:3-oxoacyl-ACP reductase FabG [Deltaproteobacteria bacterium]